MGQEGSHGSGERSQWMWTKASPGLGRLDVGVGRSRALPQEASPHLEIGVGGSVCEAGIEACGVGLQVLTSPFFSEQCDFTEDQTAGRQPQAPH